MPPTTQRVAIAVVEQDGRYLVGTRRAQQPLGGLAEFPGGRCLPGETGQACAVRECLEETGLAVTAVERLCAGRHEYEHAMLELEFWLCRPAQPHSLPAAGRFVWTPLQALHLLEFPAANRPVLEKLFCRDGPAS
jgi:mutator protein MutT